MTLCCVVRIVKNDLYFRLQYYGHRAKLKVIGREDDLMELNLRALNMAKEVAVKTGTLMAGDICNTTIYHGDDPSSVEEVREIFRVSPGNIPCKSAT